MPRSRRRSIAAVCSGAFLLLVLGLPGLVAAQETTGEPVQTGWRPRPVRNGTVSLGAAAIYGTLFGGEFKDDFNSGIGPSFNLRYRTAPDAAFGLTFDDQLFGTKAEPDTATDSDQLQMIVTTIDYYKYFSTRKRTPGYFMIGAGIAQTRITDFDGEKIFPGDGGAFVVGGGMEYWLWRTMTLDFSVRYYGVLHESRLNHEGQAYLGFNFYTSP